MAFYQVPPRLQDPWHEDALLRSWLAVRTPPEVLAGAREELAHLGALSAGELHGLLMAAPDDQPTLTQWDAWGRRVDRITLTPLWQRCQQIAAEHGLVATGYDAALGPHARTLQFAKTYLLDGSMGVYSCPLAMTDGAARTLLSMGNQALLDRALPRLLSRDPATFWTSGQWMTERTGGSDVAISETVARPRGDGTFTLHGTKWFTSATTSEMTLTLARPEGNPPGGSGLALFYLELRDAAGAMNGIEVNRLKDKLGTRMVPTAELTLEGTIATPVKGLTDGIRNITPMLGVTRTWNAVGAAGGMARSLSLARDYAKQRVAFGAPLSQKPLHVDTLAGVEAERRGAFVLAFRVVELLGKGEAGTLAPHEGELARLLTPLAKLTTGKQVVAAASEVLEAFGGAGYVEDTGLPRILRDAQVLPIWEGTTNVLSLDVLRALKRSSLAPLAHELRACTREAPAVGLTGVAEAALAAFEHAERWLTTTLAAGIPAVEAGARRFALTLGRAMEAALLVEHAAQCQARGLDFRATAAAARRLTLHGLDLVRDEPMADDAAALMA